MTFKRPDLVTILIGCHLGLGALLILAKFVGTLDWPWLWVLMPIWFPYLLTFSIIALFAMSYCSLRIIRILKIQWKRRKKPEQQ